MEEKKLSLFFAHHSQYLAALVAVSMVWDKPVNNISNFGEVAAALAIEEGWAIDLTAPINFSQLNIN